MSSIYKDYEPKFVRVNATTDGDNTVIAAVTGKTVVVLGYAINANAAGVVTLQDTANTVVASFELTDGGGVTYAGGPACPAFKLPKGLGLEISNAAGVDCLGHLTYILV